MTKERLANVTLLYIERDLSSQLWDKVDELVIKFAQYKDCFNFMMC